jgi:hypothetical protein
MLPQQLEQTIPFPAANGLAFGRSDFVKKLRTENDNERPTPIGDGVTAKGAKVRFRIQPDIARDPKKQQCSCNNTQ